MTKKFTRIEPQSTLRRLVMRAFTQLPGDVEAQPVAQLQAQRLRQAFFHRQAVGFVGHQRPPATLVVRRQLRHCG
jgi:hypothetical protein